MELTILASDSNMHDTTKCRVAEGDLGLCQEDIDLLLPNGCLSKLSAMTKLGYKEIPGPCSVGHQCRGTRI